MKPILNVNLSDTESYSMEELEWMERILSKYIVGYEMGEDNIARKTLVLKDNGENK